MTIKYLQNYEKSAQIIHLGFLQTFLNVNSASVWLPYTSIDHLLLALQKARITDPAYALVSYPL